MWGESGRDFFDGVNDVNMLVLEHGVKVKESTLSCVRIHKVIKVPLAIKKRVILSLI